MQVVRNVVIVAAALLLVGGCARKPSTDAKKMDAPAPAMAAPMTGPAVELPPVDPNRPMAPALPPGSAMGMAMVTPAPSAQPPRAMTPQRASARGAGRALPQIPSGAAPGTYGAHLASYTKETDAQRGWQVLQRSLGGQIGNLQPRMLAVDIKGRPMIRLFATGFESVDQARQLCDQLRGRQYCQVMPLG